jgi:hypothetical protein
MPLTPQITLTATLEDITGVAAGTTANPAKLQIVLCNYGLTLPQIPGTSTIAKKTTTVYSTGGQISVALWGNDVLTPVNNTYYAITVFDGEGNVVQSGNYQFTGTQTIDLSNAPQLNPVPLPPVLPPAPTPIPVLDIQYRPCVPVAPQAAGTVYTAPGTVISVFYNGGAQRPGIDWNRVTANQFTLEFATYDTDTVYALCAIVSSPGLDLVFGECSPAGPQAAGVVFTAPGAVIQVFYGPTAQRPGIDYNFVTAETFTLEFLIYAGETIYALYST